MATMSDRPPRFITPQGFARVRAEYEQLFSSERPRLVDTIAWAAANGDRSENGDYIYGRKRLREIDRRLGYLSKVMKSAKVVDPTLQEQRDTIRFGATVELADENDDRRIVTLVGEDEADASSGQVTRVSGLSGSPPQSGQSVTSFSFSTISMIRDGPPATRRPSIS